MDKVLDGFKYGIGAIVAYYVVQLVWSLLGLVLTSFLTMSNL